jgi:hypothetical protein
MKSKIKKLFLKQHFKSAFLLPFILNSLGKDITKDTEPIVTYAFSMISLNLVVLFCFVNVFGYIFSLYLISKYDIEIKFPKLKKYIYYYQKSTLFFIILETIMGFVFLIIIIIFNILLFTTIGSSLIK